MYFYACNFHPRLIYWLYTRECLAQYHSNHIILITFYQNDIFSDSIKMLASFNSTDHFDYHQIIIVTLVSCVFATLSYLCFIISRYVQLVQYKSIQFYNECYLVTTLFQITTKIPLLPWLCQRCGGPALDGDCQQHRNIELSIER